MTEEDRADRAPGVAQSDLFADARAKTILSITDPGIGVLVVGTEPADLGAGGSGHTIERVINEPADPPAED